jgi:hypothetical protein
MEVEPEESVSQRKTSCYSIGNSQSASCDISLMDHRHFPRNCLYADGLFHGVSDIKNGSSESTRVKFICIPTSIEIIHKLCFSCSSKLSHLCFEYGSRLQRIGKSAFSDCFLLESICIPASVEICGQFCFARCVNLTHLSFENDSRLERIEESAFSECLSIHSVYIPSSVKILCKDCFSNCVGLSHLVISENSELREIHEGAFSDCSSLESIFLPGFVERISGSSLLRTPTSRITVADHNCHFRVVHYFLMDFAGISLIHSFNHSSNIVIDRDIEIICAAAFSGCSSLHSLSFESGSRLR